MENDLLVYSSGLIALRRSSGKESTADLYRAACNRLRAFTGGVGLPFSCVTPVFIERFASSLRHEGLAVNSVNSYLSCFRAIYNAAVREELFVPDRNPFRFMRLRRALPLSSLQEACRLEIGGSELSRSLDFYLFSFLSCGMPFVDMAHLTHENIVGNEIVYRRHKTGTRICIGITEGMRRLLRKYAMPDSRYLFPQLCGEGSHGAYKAVLARHNACLKEIGRRLRHPVKLTSYVARHSWATEAFRQHVPVSVISQALGHTSEKTTRIYLDQLDQSVLNKANNRITRSIAELVGKTG